MSSKTTLPPWVEQARAGWVWRGATRPPFAQEPGPNQESVWDYPRPPVLVRDSRRVIVKRDDLVIVDTISAIRLLETSHPPTWYLPRRDIDMSRILRAPGSSFCEWKGSAEYYDVSVGNGRLVRAAWAYPEPIEEAFAELADKIAFYATNLECFVNGERVVPQAGGFYGGWITSDLCGPFKGSPGTSGW
jgi:uncharacterized protein (DUF427 family)